MEEIANEKKQNKEYTLNAKRVMFNMIVSSMMSLSGAILNFVIMYLIISDLGDSYNGIFQTTLSLFSYLVLAEAGVVGIYEQKLYKHYVNEDHGAVNNVLANYRRTSRFILIPYLIMVMIIAFGYPMTIESAEFSTTFLIIILLINGMKRISHLLWTAPKTILINVAEKQGVSNLITFVIDIVLFIFTFGILHYGYKGNVFGWDFDKNSILLFIIIAYAFKTMILEFSKMILIKKSLSWVNDKIKITKKISLSNVKYQFVHSISGVIVNSTDTITISIMLGLEKVSVYSAYLAISIGVTSVCSQISGVLQSIIGKGTASTGLTLSKIKLSNVLTINVAAFVTISLGILSVPFASFFFTSDSGVTYALVDVAILFAVFSGFKVIIATNNSYSYVAGKFKETAIFSLIEALLNISLSILLVWLTNSIAGVLYATVFTSLFKYVSVLIYNATAIAEDDASKIFKTTARTFTIASVTTAGLIFGWYNIEGMFDLTNTMNLIISFAAIPAIAGLSLFIMSFIFDNKNLIEFLSLIPVVNRVFKKK